MLLRVITLSTEVMAVRLTALEAMLAASLLASALRSHAFIFESWL